MAEICMPSLGADMEAGTLLEWKIAVGDRVSRGNIVGLVETQKATMELESFADGIVEELLVEPGAKVPVGTVLARVSGPSAPEPRPVPEPSAPRAPVAPVSAPVAPVPTSPPGMPHVRSSPAARKRALELGVNLAAVHGSGPHGAVILRDVVAPAPQVPRRALPVAGPVRDAIAAAMSRSKREIPHFYLSHTISLKHALGWLAETNRDRTIQQRILPGALLLRAVAVALWDFPELNGYYIEGTFRPSEEVHLATAVSLRTGGLVAPAILDADSISLDELMRELQDLVVRARGGHLKSTELTAATITVTSLGDRGCETVFPVINPPQVAIVGFGAIVERPWVEGTDVVPHPTIVATLAADHRVSDGHRGGLFLATLDRLLQEPAKL